MCCIALSSATLASEARGQVATKRDNGPYQRAVDKAIADFKQLGEGRTADSIPALAQVDPALFGVALVTVDGRVYEAGDSRREFAIESASKPFVLARTMTAVGPKAVQDRIGVNQTAQPFDSVRAIELLEESKRPPAGNPFVNAGAIATIDLLPGAVFEDKWTTILNTLSGFAGRTLSVDPEIYRSESVANAHNRGIANLLKDYKVLHGDPQQALDLYTRGRSVSVTARDLATMGATLANGGRNPLTDILIVPPEVSKRVLAVMATTGMYETSGTWLFEVGVPANSGTGGGIVAIVPGRFAVGTFSPPLDEAGNSVRGQRAISAIVSDLDGNMFGQARVRRPRGDRSQVAKR